jgi:hypothetical protein
MIFLTLFTYVNLAMAFSLIAISAKRYLRRDPPGVYVYTWFHSSRELQARDSARRQSARRQSP